MILPIKIRMQHMKDKTQQMPCTCFGANTSLWVVVVGWGCTVVALFVKGGTVLHNGDRVN